MIKVSFILPCYNVERYVADCLDSIYAQDMPEDEFEVICVNDCSLDGTRSIIVDYALQHSNLVLIDHEQNMNVGEARNSGMKVAKGEYIWFVDPDDMIRPNSADEMFRIAKTDNLDVLFFNNEVVDEDKTYIKSECVFTDSETLLGQEYVVRYFLNRFSGLCIVWRCLFKRAFLRAAGVCFPAMCKGEDVSFLWKVILVARRVASVSDIYYTYRNNPYSVAKKALDARVVFSERILFGNEICKLIEDKGLEVDATIREDMERALRWCANSNLELISRMADNEKEMYFDEITRNSKAVERVRPFMSRKQRLLYKTVGGKRLWLFKVRLCVMLDKLV